MKLSISILILILFLLFNVKDTNAQKENTELGKLEAQIAQIKEATDTVEVDIDGDSPASATMQITVKRKEIVTVTSRNKSITTKTKTKTREIEFPEIDLSKINVTDAYVNEKVKAIFARPMCGTIPSVVISQDGVSGNYTVMEDYNYFGNPSRITVPKGFVYDRASIPRPFWVIIDKDSLGNVAPLIHDLLYRNGGVLPTTLVSPYKIFSKDETDELFREIMKKCNVHPVRRELAYQAVKKFGKFAWQGK